MTSLNTSTGKDDGFVRLRISGNYQYPGVSSNPTRVYNQQLSHSGKLDLVEGDFTSVGGQSRRQIFMLNLSGSRAASRGGRQPSSTATAHRRAVLRPGRLVVPHRLDRVHRDHRFPPG